jgi:hypothetical protein
MEIPAKAGSRRRSEREEYSKRSWFASPQKPSWKSVEGKRERLREKLGLRFLRVKVVKGGDSTTRAGNSTEVDVILTVGVQAARARRMATARIEAVVAPVPNASLAMDAPSSMW